MEHQLAKKSTVEPYLIKLGFTQKTQTYNVIPQIGDSNDTVLRAGQAHPTQKITSGLYKKDGFALMVDVYQSKIWGRQQFESGVAILYGPKTGIETMEAFEATINKLMA